MKFKVNIKARLERHARNSHVFQKNKAMKVISTFKIVASVIAISLPIYPTFGFMTGISETSVGDYDNSTIITSYVESFEDDSFSKESGFIRPDGDISTDRDTAGMNELIPYVVEDGDSFSSIADKFNISINSVIWANNFTKSTTLKPGIVIKIPPVSGLTYRVQAGETVAMVAEKFKVTAEKIRSQNSLEPSQELLLNQELLIPGAIRIAEVKKQETLVANTSKNNKSSGKNTSVKKPVAATIGPSNNKKVTTKGSYLVKYNGNSKGFVWGNCTYYVALNKNVTWRGNANQWIRNASAAGVPTGSKPVAGAIVSFSGP
jgi:LysM repeat protein